MLKRTVILTLTLAGFLSAGYCQDKNIKADARVHYELGNIFYQQGRFEEAQGEYQKAIDLMKQNEQSGPQKREAPGSQRKVVVQKEIPVGGKKEVKPAFTEYQIGEDDVLKISVWQNPDLNQDVTVRPDGLISYPLIGDVPVKGLTITQLDQEITARLSEYVRSPEVSISLQKLGGSKVVVLGEISRPGVYSVTGTRTILEAIGQAGGFTRDAVASSVVLIRGGFTSPQAQRINLSKALKGQDIFQNIILQPEDVIFVPKKFIANLNYFLGQVIDPLSKGAYTRKELLAW